MVDVKAYAGRIKRRSLAAWALFLGGAAFMAVDLFTKIPLMAKGELAVLAACGMAVGVWFWWRSLELPQTEILQLAQDKGGLLTLTEIATALEVDPELVLRTLARLQRLGVARQVWEELDRNLWSFPDCVKLPIADAIDVARGKGRVTLGDLTSLGHPHDVARQTLETLEATGLAKPGGEGEVVFERG